MSYHPIIVLPRDVEVLDLTRGPMGGGVVTYAVGGRQFVAAASGSPSNFWVETPGTSLDAPGGRGSGAPTIVVFALPR